MDTIPIFTLLLKKPFLVHNSENKSLQSKDWDMIIQDLVSPELSNLKRVNGLEWSTQALDPVKETNPTGIHLSLSRKHLNNASARQLLVSLLQYSKAKELVKLDLRREERDLML